MRCRPMVVLPLPAPPWITTTPDLGRGDQLELARVDQSGDLRQVAVQALARRDRPPPGQRLRSRRRARRGQLARRPARGWWASLPGPARCFAHPLPLGAVDPLEPALLDGDGAPGQDLPRHLALAEPLLVVAALGVAIVELADRGVPPVDDVHAVGRIDEGGPADRARRARPVAPARRLARAGAGARSRASAGSTSTPCASACCSDTPCSRSIWAISAGTSSQPRLAQSRRAGPPAPGRTAPPRAAAAAGPAAARLAAPARAGAPPRRGSPPRRRSAPGPDPRR